MLRELGSYVWFTIVQWIELEFFFTEKVRHTYAVSFWWHCVCAVSAKCSIKEHFIELFMPKIPIITDRKAIITCQVTNKNMTGWFSEGHSKYENIKTTRIEARLKCQKPFPEHMCHPVLYIWYIEKEIICLAAGEGTANKCFSLC